MVAHGASRKKQQPSLRRAAATADTDDVESLFSDISEYIPEATSAEASADLLTQALDDIAGRRASTRLDGLKSLNRQLALHVHDAFLMQTLPSLQPLLIGCLRHATSDDEVCQAAHAVELIAMSVGTDGDEFLNAVIPVLKRTCLRGRNGAVQSAAIRAVAVAVLISVQHADELRSWISFMSKLVRRANADVATAALDAWALLVTQLPTKDIAGPVRQRYLKTLMALLHSSSVEVRSAAGEALALVIEADWLGRRAADDDNEDASSGKEVYSDAEQDDDDEDFSEDDDESDDVEENVDDQDLLSDEDVDEEELPEVLEVLATDGTRSRGRKERSMQRSVFRSVLATVTDGVLPRTALKIGTQKVKFGTWRDLIRLSTVRQVLAEGFHRHISSNDLVRDVLAITPRESVLVGKASRKVKRWR